MSKKRSWMVSPRPDGKWVNRFQLNGRKQESVHDTQQDAINKAQKDTKQYGGGELKIQGRNGKIREKRTIGGGNDPYPPPG